MKKTAQFKYRRTNYYKNIEKLSYSILSILCLLIFLHCNCGHNLKTATFFHKITVNKLFLEDELLFQGNEINPLYHWWKMLIITYKAVCNVFPYQYSHNLFKLGIWSLDSWSNISAKMSRFYSSNWENLGLNADFIYLNCLASEVL